MIRRNRFLIFALTITVLVFISVSCSQSNDKNKTDSASGLSGKLVLTGSSTVAPLALEIGKRFEVQHSDVRIDVQTGGSSRGIADARQGLADIGMASRSLKEDEGDLHSFTIARDGVSIILHKSNPVEELRNQEIVDIYTGKIINWREVGGQDKQITVVNKAEGRATLEVFLKYFDLKNSQIEADVIIGDNEQGIKTVAGNKNSIGYVSIGTAEYDTELGIPIKLLPVGGVLANTDNLAKGSFPLSRPLIYVTKDEPVGLVKEFIDFSRSVEVHDIIKEQYFVPVSE